ncbi:MAG: ROK family protein [Clostridia bacterium]|nr:ROK family protein [Clostridia bacterium]
MKLKSIANTQNLRQINKESVKEYLISVDSATKNEIAMHTLLSVATCGNVLKQLLEAGEVTELPPQDSTGGRPAKRFKYNENFGHLAVLYARKEDTRHTLFWQISNLLGEALASDTIVVKEMTLQAIDEAVQFLFSLDYDIKVLSLGLPGIVKDGCLFMCDFERIKHTDMASHIKKRYKVAVVVENDMNATAYGFYKTHQQQGDNIVYIYFPLHHPCGAGIIINNAILRGHSNFAGELSFLPIGVTREEQRDLQSRPAEFSQLIVKMVQCINSIINPKSVILSGRKIDTDLISTVNHSLRALPSAMHLPEITFENDIHENYVYGLVALGLEQLRCPVKLVART